MLQLGNISMKDYFSDKTHREQNVLTVNGKGCHPPQATNMRPIGRRTSSQIWKMSKSLHGGNTVGFLQSILSYKKFKIIVTTLKKNILIVFYNVSVV